MINKRWRIYLYIMVVAGFIFSCVTINIYFPQEKVESVAGKIVKDVRGGQEQKAPEPKKQKDSYIHNIKKIIFVISPSYCFAQEEITVSNATIRELKARLKNRYQRLKPYYKKGMIIEGDDGYLKEGNLKGLSLREKRDLKAMISAENRDRRALYQEVARALKIDPSQVDRVGRIFAKEWKKLY